MNVVVSACIMVIYVCASLSNHGTGRAQAGAGRRSSASLPPTAGTTRDQFRRVYLPQIGGQPNGINNRHSEANGHLVKFMGHEMDGSMVIKNHWVSSNVFLHQTGQGM
ncbi:uncharacterized protein LOC100823862 [Brachypodium distachyon]|uniref:uncharacterized protein LOC100823862 n=1 Tax=Brachypodium distachyon TaxID=15368 RepID=UPI000530009D|nr:uncharacterized protein LOC100823862 [Brachypodium distachyon]|eukprot:XP_010230875.1 uncharacterized protein LOC100823862 [Brachypodium distachyon]